MSYSAEENEGRLASNMRENTPLLDVESAFIGENASNTTVTTRRSFVGGRTFLLLVIALVLSVFLFGQQKIVPSSWPTAFSLQKDFLGAGFVKKEIYGPPAPPVPVAAPVAAPVGKPVAAPVAAPVANPVAQPVGKPTGPTPGN